MDSDDDYQSMSPPNELSPQVQFRRLKRLKKSNHESPKAPLFDSIDDPILFSHVDFAELEALENDSEPQFVKESNITADASLSQDSLSPGVGDKAEDGQIFSESNSIDDATLSEESLPQGVGDEVENGNKMELGFDVEVRKTKRVLEFDDDVVGGSAISERSENLEPEEKEIIGEEDLLEVKKEKNKNKNKKRRENSDGVDELKTKASNKRREEKERIAYLKELHAESQRLLRETGDASFKPIPVVQKPISSVLEKIRKRKLEVLKKSIMSIDNNHGIERKNRPSDRLMDLDLPNEERLKDSATITVEKEMIAPLEKQSSLAASNVDEDDAKLTIPAQTQVPANEEPIPAPRAPADDTQDLFDDSEPLGTTTLQNEKPNSPFDEDFAPSLHTMNLQLDSVPVDDSFSEEEDNDKENCNPRFHGLADSSSPNGDPVKGFIDEEAEEEDDSDNDLNRFKENESDEDIDDLEELNDMIATAYEERPADKETRDELHQKWLEQQDAAGTDNLIQRLKCGSVIRDVFMSYNEHETDEDDENDEENNDEAEEDCLPKESNRVNIKKAKQIILKLYSEKEDTYLSDGDDYDNDGTLRRKHAQYLIRKEERAIVTSPSADASSREVFGLIKKLNITSDNKRKPKALSIFDSVLKGGSSSLSTKSSFVGRVSNHHIPSSHKQGSATVRSFIFGREDSNSRSSISVSEDSSNSVARAIVPTMNPATKYSNSQAHTKARNQTRGGDVETVSRTSLLEILKRSSSQSKVCNEKSAVDLTKSLFAFRASKKPTKIEGRS